MSIDSVCSGETTCPGRSARSLQSAGTDIWHVFVLSFTTIQCRVGVETLCAPVKGEQIEHDISRMTTVLRTVVNPHIRESSPRRSVTCLFIRNAELSDLSELPR